MKLSFFICAILAIITFSEVTSQTVSCEKKVNFNHGYGLGSVKTCRMKETTTIASDEVVVSPTDLAIKGIGFYTNKNIRFLPIQLGETFPNLVYYSAVNCSIKIVLKKNFKGLENLERLVLRGNHIERIESDTFEDLTSLEVLSLANNKIKQMNGAAFASLNRLEQVHLENNICIDRDYETETPAEMAILAQEINERCGFSENSENLANMKEIMAEIENLKAALAAAQANITALQSAQENGSKDIMDGIWS